MAREKIIRAAMAAKAAGLNVTAILLLEAVAKQKVESTNGRVQ